MEAGDAHVIVGVTLVVEDPPFPELLETTPEQEQRITAKSDGARVGRTDDQDNLWRKAISFT
jgi:hypothetical protein